MCHSCSHAVTVNQHFFISEHHTDKSDSVCVHGATATAGAQIYMYYSNTTDCWGWYDQSIPKLKQMLVSKKLGFMFTIRIQSDCTIRPNPRRLFDPPFKLNRIWFKRIQVHH